MNSGDKATRSPYYFVIAGVALLGAFVIVPTPDYLSVILMSLITISVGLALGFIIRRGLRLTLSPRSNAIFAAVVIGSLSTFLCFLCLRLLPRFL